MRSQQPPAEEPEGELADGSKPSEPAATEPDKVAKLTAQTWPASEPIPLPGEPTSA